jgi:hypothetical protein
MSTVVKPETPSQALIEVQRALPIPRSRFDEFLIKAHGLAETAKQECTEALAHVVDSEATYQVVDTLAAAFKGKAKLIHDERLGVTRPIDDFKQTFVDAEVESVSLYGSTVRELEGKMSAYRQQKKREAQQAQKAAEDDLAHRRQQLESEAAKLDQKAGTLKTDAARERVSAEAESFRQAAALMPTAVTLSAAVPQNVANDVGEKWEVEELTNVPDFLRWLADHPEWHSLIIHPTTGKIHFPTGEMNRMAKQFRNVVPVPGIKFHSKDSFRTKAR